MYPGRFPHNPTPMNQRTKYAQNRISYIVYSNPVAVEGLVNQYGYEAPKNVHELVKVTKHLVKEQGMRFITDLIELHPERHAILESAEHSNFCGACGNSNYSGPEPPMPLHEMSLPQLEDYYEELKAEAREFPSDAELSKQIELVWSLIHTRKNPEPEASTSDEDPQDSKTKESEDPEGGDLYLSKTQLMGLGIAFFAGLFLAKTLSS